MPDQCGKYRSPAKDLPAGNSTQALTHLAESSDDLVLLPCSGFEADPDMLTLLATLAPCLGNSADTVRRCKHRKPGPHY